MKKYSESGSITIMMAIILPFLLVFVMTVLSILGAVSSLKAHYGKEYAKAGRDLLSFDRTLFDQYGLLGMSKDHTTMTPLKPLGDLQVLQGQILEIMAQQDSQALQIGVIKLAKASSKKLENHLRDGYGQIAMVNRKLRALMDQLVKGRPPSGEVDDLLKGIALITPFAELKGMSLGQLLLSLQKGEMSELFVASPYFVLAQEARQALEEVTQSYRDIEFEFLGHRLVNSQYAIIYLGYDQTRTYTSPTAEYVLTGLPGGPQRNGVVMGLILGIRTGLNFAEVMTDPNKRNQVVASSGGHPWLLLIETAAWSAVEAGLDLGKIKSGGRVPLWKGRDGFLTAGTSSYGRGATYRDYLTILLLAIPEELALQRIKEAILIETGQNLDHYYTQVAFTVSKEVTLPWRGFSFRKIMEGDLSYEGQHNH